MLVENMHVIFARSHSSILFADVPKLVASKITMANQGDTVTLECMVDAHPEPKMMFWRDAQGRTPVIQSSKHDVNVIRSKEDYTKFVMELTISKLTETDDGDYFCHAENSFGSSTKPVSVRIRNSVSYLHASYAMQNGKQYRAQNASVIFQSSRSLIPCN